MSWLARFLHALSLERHQGPAQRSKYALMGVIPVPFLFEERCWIKRFIPDIRFVAIEEGYPAGIQKKTFTRHVTFLLIMMIGIFYESVV